MHSPHYHCAQEVTYVMTSDIKKLCNKGATQTLYALNCLYFLPVCSRMIIQTTPQLKEHKVLIVRQNLAYALWWTFIMGRRLSQMKKNNFQCQCLQTENLLMPKMAIMRTPYPGSNNGQLLFVKSYWITQVLKVKCTSNSDNQIWLGLKCLYKFQKFFEVNE